MDIKKTNAIMRLKTELADLNKNPIVNLGLTVELIDDNNIFGWQCSLEGPSDTVYAHGKFYLRIFFPEDYPEKGPEVCFKTPIYHLNVNPRKCDNNSKPERLGHVCLNFLDNWEPKYTMRKILTNIFNMFYYANSQSPYGLDRRDEYESKRESFDEKARYYTKIYADPKRTGDPDFGDKWDFSKY